MTSLAEYVEARELMSNLTLRELRGKYKRSLLGWTWSLVNPLATLLIYTLVFSYFLKIQAPASEATDLRNFAIYLTCALVPWNFLLAGVNGSIGTLVGNANLIKKTYFPRELLVAATVASSVVTLLIEMGILVVAFMLFGNMVLPWLPVAILLLAVLTLYVTGLGLAFSVLNVYLRDVQHFVSILFQIWFYLTPIVYPLTYIPSYAKVFGISVRSLLFVNPMVGFVEALRDVLYDLQLPSPGLMAYLLVVSVASFACGLGLFRRLEGKLAEEL